MLLGISFAVFFSLLLDHLPLVLLVCKFLGQDLNGNESQDELNEFSVILDLLIFKLKARSQDLGNILFVVS